MNGNRSSSIIASIFTLVFVFGTAVDFRAEVSNPVISSLIPVNVPLGDSSHNYPQMATQLDLASLGFVEEEFYLEGSAIYYDVPSFSPAEIPSTETAEVFSTGRRYKTRKVVRGSLSEKDFNGTVPGPASHPLETNKKGPL